MRLRDAASMALGSLRASKAKTLLTILGLSVGVAAVLTVQALGAAGEVQVEREIARMGVNKVWVTRTEGGTIPAADVQIAARAAGAPLCAGVCYGAVVQLEGVTAAVQVAGYDAGMRDVHGGVIIEGRSFTATEFAKGVAVCLVDTALADTLGGDVLGRRLQLAGRLLRVVGVVEDLSLPSMAVGGGIVALPLRTFEDTFGTGAVEMTLHIPGEESASAVRRRVLDALGEDAYRADTLEKEIDAARAIVRIFVMVLASVAAVCMLTGAIGVMNVLLVSVRERRREIGLIKALGGTAEQVAAIFLLEAAFYAMLGGGMGLLLGAVLTTLFGAFMGLEAAITAGEALPVLACAAGLGLCFGVAPALRAARLQVVDALRNE